MTSDSYVGQIMLVAFNFEPQGWAFCHGQELSKTKYPALFKEIGTTFDPNREKFLLPDMRGRAPVGAGNAYTIGQQDGKEKVSIEIKNIPTHNHNPRLHVSSDISTKAHPETGDSLGEIGAWSGRSFATLGTYSVIAATIALDNQSISSSEVGSGEPLNVMQPYLPLQYIICLEGKAPKKKT